MKMEAKWVNVPGQWPGDHGFPRTYAERMRESRGVRGVKSAARTVALLELLAERGEQPSRLDQLSEDLGVPRSSMYQLLQTLVDAGWVRTDATGSLYGIGIRALLTGTGYLDGDRQVRVVRRATRESHEYLRTISRVGRSVPAHAGALGKALLADRADDELPFTR